MSIHCRWRNCHWSDFTWPIPIQWFLKEISGTFWNDLDSPHLKQFYYFQAEYQTTAGSTYSPPRLYIAAISLRASGWFHGTIFSGCCDTTRATECAVSLPLLKSHTQLNSAACRYVQSTNRRQPTLNIWRYNAFFTQEPRGPSLPTIIAFHFATLVHALWLLDLVTTQPFFTNMHD